MWSISQVSAPIFGKTHLSSLVMARHLSSALAAVQPASLSQSSFRTSVTLRFCSSDDEPLPPAGTAISGSGGWSFSAFRARAPFPDGRWNLSTATSTTGSGTSRTAASESTST